MNPSERREFFRIEDNLPVEFRRITEQEFLELQEKVKYNAGVAFDTMHEMYFLRENIVGTESKKDKLLAYMQVIDRKLDMIMEMLTRQSNDERYTARYVKVNIGGAGIRFEAETELSSGDYVEVKIILPVFPYPRLTILCGVVRAEKVEGILVPRWETALKFLAISEKDRDALVNYVFLKEREGLRSKNMEMGE
jgi:hypothetical protein